MTTAISDESLMQKYHVKGPRYTSYPTALLLQSNFAPQAALDALQNAGPALSLYVHIPFCRQLCYYCGCNKVISRDQQKADRYLATLVHEMAFYQAASAHQQVQQLHLGGGTPTFLDEPQLRCLLRELRRHFHFSPTAELSIEIDPRSCDNAKLAVLSELGFRRVSFGVQDFDAKVQQAIHREQSYALVDDVVRAARTQGMQSVNLDLVYGLPHQSRSGFAATLQQVLTLDPDRISMFSYAHLPERFAAQRKIASDTLPDAATKLALLALAVDTLTAAGYVAIGMDHFAKPHDPLAVAQQQGVLKRNFQGYTTDNTDALLGLGVSAISQVGAAIWQHEKDLTLYYRQHMSAAAPEMDEVCASSAHRMCQTSDVAAELKADVQHEHHAADRFSPNPEIAPEIASEIAPELAPIPSHAIQKGMLLSRDDLIRADIIAELMCNFKLDTANVAARWQLDFGDYFAQSLRQLDMPLADGLIQWQHHQLQVTARGRPWVRVIAACFDAYLLEQQQRYSSVV
jgi:oxygen-independent coproporphyrinogen-3 oxidase